MDIISLISVKDGINKMALMVTQRVLGQMKDGKYFKQIGLFRSVSLVATGFLRREVNGSAFEYFRGGGQRS